MTELIELEGKDWLCRIEDSAVGGRAALLLFTPLCGTCKVAERMLEVVLATERSIPIFKMNINYMPGLADSWRVTSVPCLVVLNEGTPTRFEYAMRSVDYLFGLLSKEK